MASVSTPLRLHDDVKLASPQSDVALLLRENSNAPLKLSGVSAQLAQQLLAGTSFSALQSQLAKHHPQATPEQCQQALHAFLQRLQQANMIDDGSQRPPAVAKVAGRINLPNPDALARTIASVLQRIPRWLGCTLLVMVVALALWRVAVSLPLLNNWLMHGPWQVSQLLMMAAGLPLWLVLHEMGHAVVCRLYGCPVLGAGLQFRGWWLPSAFVNTSAIALFPQRAMKVAVALAGPLVDILCLGALAAMDETALAVTVQPLLLLILMGLLFNLTPFRLSDVTRAFQAFAQPAASGEGLSWSVAGRRVFRSYCLLYGVVMTSLMVWISLVSWQRMNHWLATGAGS